MGKSNQNPWMVAAGYDNGSSCEGGLGAVWTPTADVLEDEKGFTILVELPGMTLDDVTVELRSGQLLVYGNRPCPKRTDRPRHHVVERPRGPFARAFTLGRNVQTENIRAHLKHGLLTISLKKSGPRHRSIPIG